MSSLGFSFFFLVSLFVFSELGSSKVLILRAILQIYSRHSIVDESSYSLPPQHLLSAPSWIWIWIWLLSAEFLHYLSISSSRRTPLSRRNLSLLLSSVSSACSGKSYHPQGKNLVYSYVYESEEARAEDELFLLSGECCTCWDEDTINNFETPFDCNDNLKYAHRLCVQLWSNEKDNIPCGLCCQRYQYGYIALSFLMASLRDIIWSSCSAILARLVKRVSSWVAHHQFLNLSQMASLVWKSSLSKPKINRFGLLETYSGLESYIFSSFKERALSSFSSQWERSITPPSSVTERTFPSSPYSSIEETFGVQPYISPLSVDTLLTAINAHFLSYSTEFESILQSDSITSVMLHLSDTHVDFYEILQVFQDLKKCFTSMLNCRLNPCFCWILCCRVFRLMTILCTFNV